MRTKKSGSSIIISAVLFITGALLVQLAASCGKQTTASPLGLNVQYEILNLSPDLFPVNLFIDNRVQNKTPYIFQSRQGYFYVTSTDTPYQIRTTLTSGVTFLTRDDVLKPGAKYTLYLMGARADGSLTSLFTVDTGAAPGTGRGKVRFVNVSPTAVSGLDVFANGTKAFTKWAYKSVSPYIELPIGNYSVDITNTGSATVLKNLPVVTIQDGRLYTIYAYGYTSRADTAAFNANYITNK